MKVKKKKTEIVHRFFVVWMISHLPVAVPPHDFLRSYSPASFSFLNFDLFELMYIHTYIRQYQLIVNVAIEVRRRYLHQVVLCNLMIDLVSSLLVLRSGKGAGGTIETRDRSQEDLNLECSSDQRTDKPVTFSGWTWLERFFSKCQFGMRSDELRCIHWRIHWPSSIT